MLNAKKHLAGFLIAIALIVAALVVCVSHAEQRQGVKLTHNCSACLFCQMANTICGLSTIVDINPITFLAYSLLSFDYVEPFLGSEVFGLRLSRAPPFSWFGC